MQTDLPLFLRHNYETVCHISLHHRHKHHPTGRPVVFCVLNKICEGLLKRKPFFIPSVVLNIIADKWNKKRLRIAVQKSGRLYEESVKLLGECGIDLRNVKDRLRTESDSFPLEVFFFRDDDIPQYVEDGVADVGIVGENVLLEKNKKAGIVEELGFGKCRLSIAVPRSQPYEGIASLKNKRIAIAIPFSSASYLEATQCHGRYHDDQRLGGNCAGHRAGRRGGRPRQQWLDPVA